ncbi:hypothetical protein AB0M28_13670 [Streptomyces sp. NPDC051940]|uniref:hypothetical protein n=1 Tax=Streptomyces sp. NPDC051940 TaxID=3155675 RepID=UPI00341EE7AC
MRLAYWVAIATLLLLPLAARAGAWAGNRRTRRHPHRAPGRASLRRPRPAAVPTDPRTAWKDAA